MMTLGITCLMGPELTTGTVRVIVQKQSRFSVLPFEEEVASDE